MDFHGLGILFGLGIPERKYVIIMQTRRCASSVQMIQYGESTNPAKRSEQPVLSLGAEAARLGLSVGRGAREPQCESVKRFSLVSYTERKPIPSPWSQAAMDKP